MEAKIKKTVISLQWHITEQCNNNCRHCYMERNNEDLSIDQLLQAWNRILEFEEKNDCFISRVTITGGDPLRYKHWESFARAVTFANKEIAFLGNPEVLTSRNLNLLKELNVVSYQLSLDGRKEMHDYIRGEGSFERTIEAIFKLKKYGIPVNIMFTLSSENANELFPLIDYLDSLDVHLNFAFDFLVAIGNASNAKFSLVEEIDAILGNYLLKKKQLHERKSKVNLLEKSSYFLPYKFLNGFLDFDMFSDLECDICTGCGATWTHYTILNNGDVCLCRRLPIVIGNVLFNELADLFFKNSIVKEFQDRDRYLNCGTCKFYSFCRGCPAINHAITGDFYGNSAECKYYVSQEEKHKKPSSCPPTILKNSFFSQKNILNAAYIKAITILRSFNEREFARQDFEGWLKKHKLNLTLQQSKAVRFSLLHK